MTYTHFTTDELALIESYYYQSKKVGFVAESLKRSRQTIYNVYNALAMSLLDYCQRYKINKKKCGRRPISCSVRTLYRKFKQGHFESSTLPMKGKRKPNGHKEKRGKQAFKRSIHERQYGHAQFTTDFGHLEGDIIVGSNHKSAVIKLVERLSKVIITLKPKGRQAIDIEKSLNSWLKSVPNHLFKSITFDCGKEFSNWKSVSNSNDIDIYFSDPGTPSQRGLNEHSNGLLRKDGLFKQMDCNQVDESFIQSVASRRNNIPRKSLNYKTPLKVFLSYIDI